MAGLLQLADRFDQRNRGRHLSRPRDGYLGKMFNGNGCARRAIWNRPV
jgi:hypothetical protein